MKKISKEITVDDIRKWKEELDRISIPRRQHVIAKYCKHKNSLVTINFPFKEGDCAICFEELFSKLCNI